MPLAALRSFAFYKDRFSVIIHAAAAKKNVSKAF